MRKTQSVVAALLVLIVVRSSGHAANILFVHDLDLSGDGATPAYAAADVAMINQLTSLGHSVVLIDDSLVTAAAVAGIGSADFIVLSSTASSNSFATNDSGDGNTGAANALATAATIVLMEGGNSVLTAFHVNPGGGLGTKLGTNINVLADDGYVTAGLPLGSLSIYNVASNIGTWGGVAPQAGNIGFPQFDYLGTALASVPDGTFPLNDVATGLHTVGDNKIVLLPFHNGSFTNINANGRKLFDNVFGAVPEPNSLVIFVMGCGLWSLRQRHRQVTRQCE